MTSPSVTPSPTPSDDSTNTFPNPHTPVWRHKNNIINHFSGYSKFDIDHYEPKIPHLFQWLSISKLLDEFSDDSISNELDKIQII